MFGEISKRPLIAVLSKIPNVSSSLTTKLNALPVQLLPNPSTVTFDMDDSTSLNEFPENWLHDLNRAEILISDPKGLSIFKNYLSSVKWCQSTFAGPDATVNTIKNTPNLLQRIENNTLQITRIGSKLSMPIAEYVIAMIIRIERRFDLLSKEQNYNIWTQQAYTQFGYTTIKDLKFGIFGTGDIGVTIAKSLKYGFDAQYIVGLSRTSKGNNNLFNKCYVFEEIDEMLQNEDLDYIICALPSTDSTKNILDCERLKKCRSKPWIINIGRGDLIKTDELVRCLDSDVICGAVLDVFEEEPLDTKCSLWNRDNVIVTPHVSTITFLDDVVTVFMHNLERYLNNQQLHYLVDIHKGY